jgi:ABC-type spermidine/putrescine transport system permease subunit II
MPVGKSYFTGSLFVDNVIRNPFIISLLITVLALIVFYAINSTADQNVRDKVKSGFWILIVVGILTSVHFIAVKKYFSLNSVTQNLQDSARLISAESGSTAIDDTLVDGKLVEGNNESPISSFITPNVVVQKTESPESIIDKLPSSI